MSRNVFPIRQTLCVVVFLVSIQLAASQNPPLNPFGMHRGSGGRSSGDSAPEKTSPGVRAPSGSNPGPSNAPKPVGTITDTGFAGRLGHTVGSQGFPTVALPPGVSNINHPGLQPMPSMQPLPTGLGQPLPSINFPGGTPSMHTPPRDPREGKRHGFSGRGTSGIIYYGVPYYVPYYVYPQEIVAGPGAATTAASGYAAPPQPGPGVLTLLAFKDHSVVVVVEYWLEGDWLYYITPSGYRLSGPLDRLDQPLTQQLNRERNVPFILGARR